MTRRARQSVANVHLPGPRPVITLPVFGGTAQCARRHACAATDSAINEYAPHDDDQTQRRSLCPHPHDAAV